MTNAVIGIASPLGVAVQDHIIVGKCGREPEGNEADLASGVSSDSSTAIQRP
jgi:hypothetical protein